MRQAREVGSAAAGSTIRLRDERHAEASKETQINKSAAGNIEGRAKIPSCLGEPVSVVERCASEGMLVRREGRYAGTTPDELECLAWERIRQGYSRSYGGYGPGRRIKAGAVICAPRETKILRGYCWGGRNSQGSVPADAMHDRPETNRRRLSRNKQTQCIGELTAGQSGEFRSRFVDSRS